MLLQNVEDQLELTFTYLPTRFSRLAFLASVRDSYTGRYLHEGWVMISSRDGIHEILQRTHKQVFDLVLKMSLLEMCAELRRYFESLTNTEGQTLNLWLELQTYRDMIPQGASEVSREFFLSQMKIALKTLLTVPDWSRIRAQSASPRQLLVLPRRPHLEN